MSLVKKIFLIVALVSITLPFFVFADSFGIEKAAQGTNLIRAGQPVDQSAIPELIGNIIGIVLSFVGVIFFLLILYGGFTWMTAFGNEEKVTKAKGIMEHAILGLVIVISAYAISRFVFGALTEDIVSPTTPTGEASVGCCVSGENPPEICIPNGIKEICEQDAANHWVEGNCPANCALIEDNL